MKTKSHIFCAVLLALALAAGCSKSAVSDVQVVDVKKEFTLVPWEKLESGGGVLQMITTSLTPQNCTGTKIDYYSALINNKLTLTIKQYLPPPTCDNVMSTVTDTLELGRLDPGTYKLQINLKDAVLNDGSLTVDKSSYVFKTSTENGISLPVKTILRVPPKTIWGYVDYTANLEGAANNFIDSLKTLTSPAYNSAGDYHYFKIDASNQVDFTVADARYPAGKKFLLNLEKDPAALISLIERFRANNKTNIDIRIYTYEGAVL